MKSSSLEMTFKDKPPSKTRNLAECHLNAPEINSELPESRQKTMVPLPPPPRYTQGPLTADRTTILG